MANVKNKAILFYDNPNRNVNLYYLSHFMAPDPYVYILYDNKSYIITRDLECERAQLESTATKVMTHDDLKKQFGNKDADLFQCVTSFLLSLKVDSLVISQQFNLKLLDVLISNNIEIEYLPDEQLIDKRVVKTDDEVAHIEEAVRYTEETIEYVINIIRASKIEKNNLTYNGKKLTSEFLRNEAMLHLLKNGYVCMDLIISSGDHAALPHHLGAGPVMAKSPIIIDIFPRSLKHYYFGDITRTVIKGKPTSDQQKMYQAVYSAQSKAFDLLKEGVLGTDVHKSVVDYFEKAGFKAKKANGVMQGFIHGTGHGLGLEIHEYPYVNASIPCKMRKGNVVTVEPGLYYHGIGGIRIEDDVVIKKNGIQNLSKMSKEWVIE